MPMDSVSPPSTPTPFHPQPVAVPLVDLNVMDRHLLGLLLLLAFATSTCLIGLRHGPSLGDHEAINALAARDAIDNGRWLIPRPSDEPCVRKTPLGIWAIAGVSNALQPADEKPVNTFTARLPSAVAAIVNVAAVFWLGVMMFGHRAGLVSGFVMAACAATLFFARNAQADQLLATFTTLSFAFFWRGALQAPPSRLAMAGFYICFALAMMTKAPLPLVTVGLSLAVFWFFTLPIIEAAEKGSLPQSFFRRWSQAMGRRFGGVGHLWLLPGIILFAILAGAWPLYVYFKVDNALELWRMEYLDRYSGTLSDKTWPFWYYIPCIFGLTFPFLASIPEAVAAPFLPRYAVLRRGLGYALTWAGVTTIFLSTASFKRPHYLLSAIPAFCLLLGPVVDRLFFGTLFATKRTISIICAALPFLLGGLWALGLWYARREFPEVSRILAISLAIACVFWIAASLAFYASFRRTAFGLLLLAIPAMLATSAPALGEKLAINDEADRLGKALVEHNIEKAADIYWADGRPNAAVEFYTGYRIRRIMDVLEAAAHREGGRESVSSEFQESIGERIAKRMADSKPAYFIMSKPNYEMLASSSSIPHRVVFEVIDANPRQALVVFTQD